MPPSGPSAGPVAAPAAGAGCDRPPGDVRRAVVQDLWVAPPGLSRACRCLDYWLGVHVDPLTLSVGRDNVSWLTQSGGDQSCQGLLGRGPALCHHAQRRGRLLGPGPGQSPVIRANSRLSGKQNETLH